MLRRAEYEIQPDIKLHFLLIAEPLATEGCELGGRSEDSLLLNSPLSPPTLTLTGAGSGGGVGRRRGDTGGMATTPPLQISLNSDDSESTRFPLGDEEDDEEPEETHPVDMTNNGNNSSNNSSSNAGRQRQRYRKLEPLADSVADHHQHLGGSASASPSPSPSPVAPSSPLMTSPQSSMTYSASPSSSTFSPPSSPVVGSSGHNNPHKAATAPPALLAGLSQHRYYITTLFQSSQ